MSRTKVYECLILASDGVWGVLSNDDEDGVQHTKEAMQKVGV